MGDTSVELSGRDVGGRQMRRRLWELTTENTRLTRENAGLSHSVSSLQVDLDKARTAKHDLESDLARAFELFESRENELKATIDSEMAESEKIRTQNTETQNELSRTKAALKTAEEDVRSAKQATQLADLAAKEREIHARSLNEELQARLDNTTACIQKRDVTIAELESTLEAQRQMNASSAVDDADRKALDAAVTANRRLNSELLTLKSRLDRCSASETEMRILEEQIRTLRSKVTFVEEERDELAKKLRDADIARIALTNERTEWASYLDEHDPAATSPVDVVRALAAAQAESRVLSQTVEALRDELRIARDNDFIDSLQHELAEARESADVEKGARAQLQVSVAAYQKKVELLEQRLGTQDSELAELDRKARAASDEAEKLRINSAAKRRRLSSESPSRPNLSAALAMREREIEGLKAELAKLNTEQKRYRVLEARGSSYEEVVGPRLRLCAKLEEENKALREQLSGSDKGALGMPSATVEVLSEQLKAAQTALERHEQRAKRIATAFRVMKHELDAACVDLLGYSVEVLESRDAVLKPAWALHDAAQAFEFVYDPDKKCYVDIAWTSIVRQFEDQYRFWIQEKKSLPGFLAAVFLEQLEKHGPPPPRIVRSTS